ncbi:hypothetical protein AMK26_10735 [Streptomyces sp. CB03234]|uniref:hypothetical protein n=1 Tax=Streptomyces sp. (strain CB03234) TaxID=1703937 RepID=UPI00093D098B|nr:hypothetical protein [Streptomyces sp. CB03234]OKK06483.1 hypothetical protein AMK26_10735 [Streptomyces sp. CB03234]
MIRNVLGAALAGAVLIAPGTATAAHARTPAHETDWQRVGDGITSGISGRGACGGPGGAVTATDVCRP